MNRLRNDHMQHMPHFTKFMFQLIDDMITIGCRLDLISSMLSLTLNIL